MTSETPYRHAGHGPSGSIVVTTGPDVPGFRITQVLAVVHGVAMRPSGMASGTALPAARATRETAAARLLEEARGIGANAIIGMRFDSNGDEVCAYGTAVTIAE